MTGLFLVDYWWWCGRLKVMRVVGVYSQLVIMYWSAIGGFFYLDR